MDRALRTVPGRSRPYGYVVWVEPEDGAHNVMRDAIVLVRASIPVDPLHLAGIEVRDAEGRIPARLEISSDPCVVVWRPQRLLRAGAQHIIVVEGWRDGWGRGLPPFRSRFVSGPVGGQGLTE
jgi:hypothetical protein